MIICIIAKRISKQSKYLRERNGVTAFQEAVPNVAVVSLCICFQYIVWVAVFSMLRTLVGLACKTLTKMEAVASDVNAALANIDLPACASSYLIPGIIYVLKKQTGVGSQFHTRLSLSRFSQCPHRNDPYTLIKSGN